MEFNPDIIETLQKANISKDNALAFLLSLHFNIRPDVLFESQEGITMMELLGIFSFTEKGEVEWKVPLFKGQDIQFNWVAAEYCYLFEKAGKNKYHREALARMKKLFAQNPDIRKEEVLSATEMYLNETPSTYVKFPHYFIEKGVGANRERSILTYIDRLRLVEKQNVNRTGQNMLQ